jgi:hypothetical protein
VALPSGTIPYMVRGDLFPCLGLVAVPGMWCSAMMLDQEKKGMTVPAHRAPQHSQRCRSSPADSARMRAHHQVARARFLFPLGVALLSGCSDQGPTGPGSSSMCGGALAPLGMLESVTLDCSNGGTTITLAGEGASLGESNAHQTRLDPNDFGPAGYTLANVGAGVALATGPRTVHLDVALRNAFNKEYQNFLSRYKFASDPVVLDAGRNLTVRVSTDF